VPGHENETQEAITAAKNVGEAPAPKEVEPASEAVVWLRQGQQQEGVGALAEAVASYDRALDLLKGSAEGGQAAGRRELALVWMNRGNALQKMTEARAWTDALDAYRQAIEGWESLPQRDTGASVSLGCAHMNQAGVWQKLGRLAEAAEACERAIALLREPEAEPNCAAHARLMLAAAWLNRGGIALEMNAKEGVAWGKAHTCARTALELVGERERNELPAAEIALKARRLLCEASARRLGGETNVEPDGALLSEASDSAEAALALVEHCERQGFHGFDSLGNWFFRFGVSFYAEYQPHFLGEFALENISALATAGNPVRAQEWRALAAAALARARVRLHSLLFNEPQAAKAPRWGEALSSLVALDQKLGEMA